MSETRDTQFAGWAKAVLTKIDTAIGEAAKGHIDMSEQEFANLLGTIIARAGYDLVKHTIENVAPYHLDALSIVECVERIPDMAELPEEQEV